MMPPPNTAVNVSSISGSRNFGDGIFLIHGSAILSRAMRKGMLRTDRISDRSHSNAYDYFIDNEQRQV